MSKEETDALAITTLKVMSPKITNFSLFDSDTILAACALFLKKANYGAELPTKIPNEVSGKTRVGTVLVNALTELGYSEMGVDVLLYPNANTTRKLIRWLVNELSRVDETQEDSATGNLDIFQRTLMEALAAASKKAYVPRRRVARTPAFNARLLDVPGDKPAEFPKSAAAYNTTGLSFVTAQPLVPETTLPSILAHAAAQAAAAEDVAWLEQEEKAQIAVIQARKKERMSRLISSAIRGALALGDVDLSGSGSPFARRSNVRLDNDDASGRLKHQADFAEETAPALVDESTRQKEREALLAELEARLRELQNQSSSLEDAAAQTALSKRQLEANELSLAEQREQVEKEHAVKTQVYRMAQNLEENLASLKEISQGTAARLLQLTRDWEKHRVPLFEHYRKAKDERSASQAALKAIIARREKVREEMKQLIQMAREKEEQVTQLQAEYDRLPHDVNRGLYTKRIIEIIKNVKKQQIDIDKILIDIHQIRKEINATNDTLQRSFHATDELIWKQARTGDEAVKSIYRNVVEMNESFGKLVRVVEETGSTLNNARELELQADHLAARSNDMALDRVLADLQQIKAENAQLMQRVRQ